MSAAFHPDHAHGERARTRAPPTTARPQAYPASVVTVTSGNGLDSSGGTLSFTYNGLSVPTNAGNYTVVVSFTPNDPVHYTKAASITTTWTINALAVNLTGSRTYDATATANASILSVANAISNDNVTVVSGAAHWPALNAGGESIVSFGTLALGGTAASNYTLHRCHRRGDDQCAQAVNLTGSRTYDGTTTASASILSVANAIGGDNVTVVSGSGTLAMPPMRAWSRLCPSGRWPWAVRRPATTRSSVPPAQ